MTAFRFRLLLVLYIILGVANGAAAWYFPDLVSPALQAASEAEGEGWHVANLPLSIWLLLPWGVGNFAGLVGMFMFKSWGRSCSLVFTVVDILLLPSMGTSVLSWLDYGLMELGIMVWGAILALAYYSPVSSLFSGARGTHV